MLKQIIAVSLFVTSLKAQKFNCSNTVDSSEFNRKANFKRIANHEWTFLANVDPLHNVAERPFNIAPGESLRLEVESTFQDKSMYKQETLKINFYCTGNQSISTFVALNKIFTPKDLREMQNTYNLCSGENILGWQKMFIEMNFKENLLMIYSCSAQTELLTLFATSKKFELQRADVESAANEFVRSINSSLWRHQNLSFFNHQPAVTCENFKNVCLKKPSDVLKYYYVANSKITSISVLTPLNVLVSLFILISLALGLANLLDLCRENRGSHADNIAFHTVLDLDFLH